jgi:hypothetical protein
VLRKWFANTEELVFLEESVKNPAKDKDKRAKIGDWRSSVELTRKDKPRTPLSLFKVEEDINIYHSERSTAEYRIWSGKARGSTVWSIGTVFTRRISQDVDGG